MKKIVFLLLIILLVTTFQVKAEKPRFVLFIMDRVDLTEIKNVSTPNLDKMLSIGAIGLMNTRTAGSLEPKDSYLTIGTGDRSTVGADAYYNFNLNESYYETKIEDIYLRRFGKLNNEAKIVNIELSSLVAANNRSKYQAKIGYLGDMLSKSNLELAVLGNADIWQQVRRHVAVIGINQFGIINHGDVGPLMKLKMDQHPSGYITNQDYLLNKFRDYLSTVNLIIIESGATSRVEAVKLDLSVNKFKNAKKLAIKRVDRLLGKIMKELNFNKDYLLLITPTSSRQGIKTGNKLTLVSFLGSNLKGLLTSGTTKRNGLITNVDIAPTIYKYLTGKSGNFTGQAITTTPSDKSINYLYKLNQMIRTTFKWRPILVKGFILLQIVTLVLIGIILIYKNRFIRLKKVSVYLLLSLLWIPCFFLLSRYVIEYNFVLVVFIYFGLSLFFTYCTLQLSSHELIPILVPTLITLFLLVLDLWTGGNFIKLSILGYSPVIGARFYGLGNEFMGIIIGVGLIGLIALLEINKRISINSLLLFFIFLILTIGHPNLGANFGGLLTATVVFTSVFFRLKGYYFNLSSIFKLLIIMIIIISIVVSLDVLNNTNNQTHLAHTLSAIKTEGVSKLITIFYRKLSMNLKLLRWTIWTRVLLAFVVILIILFKNPRGKIRDIIDTYPQLSISFKGGILGSIVTMLVNDSGVVAAATLLLFPVFTLLYLVLNRINLI